MKRNELLNLIDHVREDERHHTQVQNFLNEISQGVSWRRKIPYTDLKYDTLYLAANTHSNCYYIFVPSHKQVEGKIGIYWMKINSDTVPSRRRKHLARYSLNFSSYVVGVPWVRKLEEIKDFTTPFLNWQGEPWEGKP